MAQQGRGRETCGSATARPEYKLSFGAGLLASLDALATALQIKVPIRGTLLTEVDRRDDPTSLYSRSRTRIEEAGFPVVEYDERTFRGRVLIGTGRDGVATEQGEIHIRADLDAPYKLVVLLHEYAHQLLHVGKELPEHSVNGLALCECEAEAAGYLAATWLGVYMPELAVARLIDTLGEAGRAEQALIDRADVIVHGVQMMMATLQGVGLNHVDPGQA